MLLTTSQYEPIIAALLYKLYNKTYAPDVKLAGLDWSMYETLRQEHEHVIQAAESLQLNEPLTLLRTTLGPGPQFVHNPK